MLSSRLARRSRKDPVTFKPSVCVLEDRTVPSGFWWRNYTPPPPGPATHLEVETRSNVKSGQEFFVEVEALDANNRIATGYLGTVHFSLGTTDNNALLPADYTFVAGDNGEHWFSVTLAATGNQIINVADKTTSSIAGTAAINVTPAPAATHFAIITPPYSLQNGTITVTVVALDKYGHVATGYNGQITFGSSDGNASLPGDYTFVTADHGRHAFQVTFAGTGSQTVTATDKTTTSITGKGTTNVEAAGSVTHFGLYSFGIAAVGVPTSVLVVALDANNHVVAGYAGAVKFTSGDGSAIVPAQYTFLPSDNGRHIVSVTFNTPGTQTFTATDTVTSSITATVNFRVFQKPRFPWGWF
jgi:hypothetical protein